MFTSISLSEHNSPSPTPLSTSFSLHYLQAVTDNSASTFIPLNDSLPPTPTYPHPSPSTTFKQSPAKCNQQHFRDKDGNWASGAIVSKTTRLNHCAADNQVTSRFRAAQDSDKDSPNEDHDDHACPGTPEQSNSSYNVSELNILDVNKLDLSSSRPSPRPSPDDAYDCSMYHQLSLRHSDPAVLHMSLMTAMLSVLSHTSSKTSSWLMKSGQGLMTLAASGGLGESHYQPLNF
ncbi:hypothetical protein PGT21_014169 [Puccinia graminis f. sp. tritici]|uniref:Uncharacterized protein n=1 Tax=Puccinia graminis f. sp. tritici TaxID=56615 RepID=A0A5B0MA90_PUCGR|nr:hypothetical protein PGT21_014169 [Puccinia graminis f. sp. tritici]